MKQILIFFIIGGLFLLSCSEETGGTVDENKSAAEVKVCNPQFKTMIEYLELNGTTLFLRQQNIRSTLNGFIIKSTKSIGYKVKKGELLFTIKTKEAAAIESDGEFKNKSLFSGEVNIYAPQEGVVIELNKQIGDYISDGDNLALIIDPSSLKIKLNVPYQYSTSIENDAIFNTLLPDGRVFKAYAEHKIPSINPIDQTQTFLLALKGAPEIPANLNVYVNVPVKIEKAAIVLPRAALMTNETESEFWIMKLSDQSMANRVDVKPGIVNDSLFQILEPNINPADKIVCEGAYSLPDSSFVSVIE